MSNQLMEGNYHTPLVILSLIIIVIASYTAFGLASRITASRGAARRMWLIFGAVTMGTGIWAMHFVGMLAFHLPIEVNYDLFLVLLSVLPAILAAGIAMYISHQRMSGRQVVNGSLSMAAGIAFMHYTGMEAMRMPAGITYDPPLFVLSLLIAVFASAAALYLLNILRFANHGWQGFWLKMGCAVVMGAAVSGMHYTGMAASMFEPMAHGHQPAGVSIDTLLLAYAVGVGAMILSGFALLGTFVDRLFASQSMRLDYTELRYRSLYEHNPDAVFTLSLDGYFAEVNPAAEKLFGYKADELTDMLFLPFVAKEDVERIFRKIDMVKNGQPQNDDEVVIVSRGGMRQVLHITGVPLLINSEVTAVSFIAQNITERKRQEEAVNYMAFHDDLTRLPNRRRFNERAAAAVEEARAQKTSVYVMILDMDRFKNYNDTFGHAFGDDLLVAFAERLRAFEQENTMVARLGGDEFTLLLTGITVEEVERTAQAILVSIATPFAVRGHELSITTSIGIAAFPEDGEDVETLMKNADTAMYRAKERGNRYQLYNPAMNPKAYEKIVLEMDLRKALERDEFLVYYQPQVDMNTRQVKGVEALVRWMHPERGMVSPGQFIPIAEESGLIVPIGLWVLRSACQQGKRWQEAGQFLRVSVNLSLRQFLDQDLVKHVERVLEETGFPPEYLELEITESMTMDVERAIQVLQDLKQLNVHVAIDDFGTGYSSLSYLKRFPIDRLKIDQSFVRDIHLDLHDAEIVTTIISMAHNLRLLVTAEGVETEEQLAFLKEYGCDEAQGYYFARPLPAEEVMAFLISQSVLR